MQEQTVSIKISCFHAFVIVLIAKIAYGVSGDSRAVKRRASKLTVRGSTPALDETFVRCFSVSPTHTESEKMCLLASHAGKI